MTWPLRASGQKIANELGLDHRLATEYLRRVRDEILENQTEVEHELVGIFGLRHQHAGWKHTKLGCSFYPEFKHLRLRQPPRERTSFISLRTDNSNIDFALEEGNRAWRFRLD